MTKVESVNKNHENLFKIVNMVRQNNIHNPMNYKMLISSVKAFLKDNTSDNDTLKCRLHRFTRFRLRFFDFVGRVWDWDSYDSDSHDDTPAQDGFVIENDDSLASWFDPKRKPDGNKNSNIPETPRNNVLCLLLNHKDDEVETLGFPKNDNIMVFPLDLVKLLAKDEKLFITFIEKINASYKNTLLSRWQTYLSKVLLLSQWKEMTAEKMTTIFYESLRKNITDAHEKNIELDHSYAYIFPCITGNEVSCLLTVRVAEPLQKKDVEHICKVVLPSFANLALLLSARITKIHATENRMDLTHTYSRTQSEKIWEDIDNWYNNKQYRKIFGNLSLLYKMLTKGLSIPVGDCEISKAIRDHFLVNTLDKVIPRKLSRERLLALIDAALDDEDKLRGIPRYRQHFIHSFHVFLTGLRILIEKPPMEHLLKSPLEIVADRMGFTPIKVLKTWFYTAIFHDISYSVANVEEWVGFFIDHVMLDSKNNNNVGKLQEQWVRNQIARLFRFEHYHDSFTNLVKVIAKYSELPDNHLGKLSNQIYTMLLGINEETIPVKSDHGILSALMFLNAFERDHLNRNKDILMYAADAIAHHNDPASILRHVVANDREIEAYKNKWKNPLRDLLIICDQIQQWGRTESEKSLSYFNIELDMFKWVKSGSSSTANLYINVGYKRPTEDSRVKQKEAKDFYEKKWNNHKDNNQKGIFSKIRDLEKGFHAPCGDIILTYAFDSTYVGQGGDEPIPHGITFKEK